MQIYPAIDLLEGKCVRLFKGDFDQSTEYSADPIAVAAEFREQGAQTLHLVDLSGAKNPDNRQTALIETIIRETDMTVQCGGGVRTASDVQELLNAGVERVVIGSLAVKNPKLTKDIIAKYGNDHICLAIDVAPDEKYGYAVATSGWQIRSSKSLEDIIGRYRADGLKHVLCTDISRDGTLEGPNTDLYKTIQNIDSDLIIQASGGVGSLDDLKALSDIGVDAAITGKAIYEDCFTVAEAIELAQKDTPTLQTAGSQQ